MDNLTIHQREVLTAFADATEPLDVYDVVESLLPKEPQIGWGGSGRREYQAWLRRRNVLHKAANLLWVDGLLAEAPDGQSLVVTEAGREALAEAVSD